MNWGKDTIIPRVVLQGRLDGTLGPQNRFLLGGFLNLSGFQSRELSGEYLALGQIIYLHRLDDASAAFTIPVYLGGSLEVAMCGRTSTTSNWIPYSLRVACFWAWIPHSAPYI
ncbi:MAG: hypothetical protein R3F37_01785 [Candidatus Competibacteraceae bacterium]